MKRATVGYKSTDIGAIPADWQVSAVGDLFLVDPENLPASTSHLLKIKYIAISDVEHGRLRRYTRVFFGNAPLSARKKLRKGDVLISTVRPNLKSHYLLKSDEDCFVCSTGFSVLRARNSNALSEFFYHNLFAHCINLQIESALVGSTYPVIKSSDVKKLRIPLPKPSEQKAIATALSDVDGLIENIERLIAKKRDMKTAAMQVLLTGKKRLVGFGDGTSTKKTDIGSIPDDWAVSNLGDVSNITTGTRNNQDKSADGTYPFFVRSAFVERIQTYSDDCEAILIPGEGGIGSIFHYINGRFDFHQRVYAVTKFSDDVWGKYVYYYLNQFFGKHALRNTVKATVDSLRLPTFQVFSLAHPRSIGEQKAIASILSDMDAEIEALQKRLAKTKAIKIAMMQELLTGKTRLVKP